MAVCQARKSSLWMHGWHCLSENSSSWTHALMMLRLAQTCPVWFRPHHHTLLLVCWLPTQEHVQKTTQGCNYLIPKEDMCLVEWLNEWMNEQINAWMDGCMDGWMVEWRHERMTPAAAEKRLMCLIQCDPLRTIAKAFSDHQHLILLQWTTKKQQLKVWLCCAAAQSNLCQSPFARSLVMVCQGCLRTTCKS